MADEKKEEKTLEEAFSELDVLAGRLVYDYAGFYGRNSACIFPCEKAAPEIAVDLRIEYFLLDCIHGIKARSDTFRGMERVAGRYADSGRKGAHE